MHVSHQPQAVEQLEVLSMHSHGSNTHTLARGEFAQAAHTPVVSYFKVHSLLVFDSFVQIVHDTQTNVSEHDKNDIDQRQQSGNARRGSPALRL
jgi:hypothetical protein